MSENDDLNRAEALEELLLLEALDGLQAGDGAEAAAGIEERLRALTRQHLEVLGALPRTIAPLAPRDEVKDRVMAAARADLTRGTRADSLAFPRAPTAPRSSRVAPFRMLPLAAALALALIGLSAWQFHQLGDQRRQLGRLADEVDALGVSRGELATAHGELAKSRTRLAMATTPGAEYCVLRPPGQAAAGAAARGTLVVAPDRGSWYLRVEGLEPCPKGGTYRFWFLTQDGPVPGGAFDIEATGEGVELSASEVPAGFHGVSVTLERGEGGSEPAGPQVLFADQAMRLL